MPPLNGTGDEVNGGAGSLTVIGDPDPIGDVCSNATRNQVQMSGKNIGDLLNAAGVTWGSFMGGFDLTAVNSNNTTGCNRSSTGGRGLPVTTFRTMRGSSITLPRRIPSTRAPRPWPKSGTTARPTMVMI
jgi:hypothetical protein